MFNRLVFAFAVLFGINVPGLDSLLGLSSAHAQLVIRGPGSPGTPVIVSPIEDTTPNSFSFTDQTDVDTNTTITSSGVAITGINAPTPCTVTGGTIDVAADANFQSSRDVTNNQSIRARHTSSGSNSTATNTVVDCGGVSDTFTSTTLVAAGGMTDCVTQNCLYVDPSHPSASDATSKASNSASMPWATIGRALWGSTNRSSPNTGEAADAGDTVRIACGTYTTTGTGAIGFTQPYAAFSPINNGDSHDDPIRVQSYDNEFACIDVVYTSGTGSVIGSHQRSYIQWSGFNLNETNTPWPGTGFGFQTAQVWISGDPDAVGNVIENSRLEGTSTSARDGDNYTLIRLHGTDDTTIRNVHIRNVGDTDENSGCTLWYFSINVTVENSTLENCGNGTYMKGMDPSTMRESQYIFRFNRFVDNYYGVTALRNANGDPPSAPILVYQNIFETQRGPGFRFNHFADSTDPNDIKLINNLFVGNALSCLDVNGNFPSNAGHEYRNNICQGTGSNPFLFSENITPATSFVSSRFISSRNVYKSVNTSSFAGGVSFATWQGTHGQDADSVTTSANLFSDADYHNDGSSPALNLGRAVYGIGGSDGTTINAGPYITGSEVIGHVE